MPDLQKGCLAELNQATVTIGNLFESIFNLDQKDILDQKNDELAEEEKPEQTIDTLSVKVPPSPENQPSAQKIAKYTPDGKLVIT